MLLINTELFWNIFCVNTINIKGRILNKKTKYFLYEFIVDEEVCTDEEYIKECDTGSCKNTFTGCNTNVDSGNNEDL